MQFVRLTATFHRVPERHTESILNSNQTVKWQKYCSGITNTQSLIAGVAIGWSVTWQIFSNPKMNRLLILYQNGSRISFTPVVFGELFSLGVARLLNLNNTNIFAIALRRSRGWFSCRCNKIYLGSCLVIKWWCWQSFWDLSEVFHSLLENLCLLTCISKKFHFTWPSNESIITPWKRHFSAIFVENPALAVYLFNG